MKTQPPVEILETRIAPAAIFFVSGTSLDIKDSTGADAAGSPEETDAASATGATKAVLLGKGDSLVYDLNGNHKADKGEQVLLKITTGSAMAFFTDLNTDASISQIAQFDLNEFTGLAAGDGLVATITGDIHGSIDTLLSSTDDMFKTTRQVASIDGLKITGSVDGNIQAGGNISNVTFTAPKTDAQNFDVHNIFTGNAADNGISMNGGGTSLSLSFTQAPGADGGDISNIKIPRSIGSIHAGGGGDNTTGNGGAGGDVSVITINGVLGSDIIGGNGGVVTTSGAAGAGGSVSSVTATLLHDSGDPVNVNGGVGGSSTDGAGGAGGGLSKISITTLGRFFQNINFNGGNAGSGGDVGAGGAGGSLLDTKVTTKGYITETVNFRGGAGGDGGSGGANGGAGGSVSKATITGIGTNGGMEIIGGNGGSAGGDGFTGGAGGAVTMAMLKSTGYVEDDMHIVGGSGGSGGTGNSAGGAGGTVTSASFFGNILDEDQSARVEAGDGGDGGDTGGNGGAGGNILKTKMMIDDMGVDLLGGDGGAVRSGNNFKGGAGGAVSDATISVISNLNEGADIIGGRGGAGGSGSSTGGKGGDVTKVKFSTIDTRSVVTIAGGDGGQGGDSAGGAGGAGGSLSMVTFSALGYVEANAYLRGGNGGGRWKQRWCRWCRRRSRHHHHDLAQCG